jgi:glutamate-ammonia-ligase adenylyltransferase
VRGRASDSLPTDVAELASIAAVLRPGGIPTELTDEYLRVTRRSRAVMERIFYGEG